MKLILLLLILVVSTSSQAAPLADHTFPGYFNQITASDFEEIAQTYNIFYGHTSHGSQIRSGLDMLDNEGAAYGNYPSFSTISSDLGHTGSLVWESQTRSWLESHPETNLVMWSWCGGASDNTEEGINIYLNAMAQLELDYPDVIFIYMTGHLDGGGVDGNLYRNNNYIREFCQVNDKVLFDFADIESWDPADTYYPDETDACGWCSTWCSDNDCPPAEYCAHSNCFNCYQKGKSFWWLLFKLSSPGVAAVSDQVPNFSFELSPNFPNPFNPQTEVKLNVKKPGMGTLAVYDIAGNKVSTLYDGYFEAGRSSFTWNATKDSGNILGSGIYFCRLQIGDEIHEVKMTLLK